MKNGMKRCIILLCIMGMLTGCSQYVVKEKEITTAKTEEKKIEPGRIEKRKIEPKSIEPKFTESKVEELSPKEGDSMRLHVSGTEIQNENGKAVLLQGVSTHGLHWFPQYVTKETFATFKENWNCNAIRLAMYTGEGGYCTGADQSWLKNLIDEGVEYCRQLGMYVIIDWHTLNDDRDPNTFKEDACAFWEEISKKYCAYDHVIYEICNEPNSTSWSQVKSYAEDVIEVIRKNDRDNLILVGTPQWCQLPAEAARDPLKNSENVVFTVHFYATSHRDEIRNNLVEAHNMGLPLLISEYSICDASGNGGIDYESAEKWFTLLDQYGIGRVAWNISNKNESSALLRGEKLSDWLEEDLSESGKWIKNKYIQNK